MAARPSAQAGTAGLGILAFAVFATSLDIRAAAPLLPAIASDLGESVAATGLIVTAYSVPYGVLQLAYGPLGDRVGRLKVITGVYAVFMAGTAISGLAPSLPVLIAIRALTGAAAAGVYPLALAHIGDTVPYHRRQAAVGLLVSTASVAQVLSVSVGGIVGQFLSWRLVYLSFGVMALATWLALVQSQRQQSAAEPAAVDSGALDSEPTERLVERLLGQYVRVYRIPGAAFMFGLVFMENVFLAGGFAYLGAAIHERFGLNLLVVGLLLTGYGIGAFGVARALGSLVRRFGERNLVLGGGLLMGSGYVLAELMPVGYIGFAATLLLGIGFSAAHSTLQTRMTELDPRARGTALALHAFHAILGQAAGAAALGAVLALTGSYDILLWTAAIGLVAFGVVGGLGLRNRQPG